METRYHNNEKFVEFGRDQKCSLQSTNKGAVVDVQNTAVFIAPLNLGDVKFIWTYLEKKHLTLGNLNAGLLSALSLGVKTSVAVNIIFRTSKVG